MSVKGFLDYAYGSARNDRILVISTKRSTWRNLGHLSKILDPSVLNLQPGMLQDAGFALRGTLLPENAFRNDTRQFSYILYYHIVIIL